MSSQGTEISRRKVDHVQINLDEDVRSAIPTGFSRWRFEHRALPDLDLADVNTKLDLFGRAMRSPILISSMTGGADELGDVNRRLAEAAQAAGVAMGVGSQRAALDAPAQSDSFRVRDLAPDILLLANLGAVQLNLGYGVEECHRAVDMIEADALILHLNPLQEAVQPEGDTRFRGLLGRIAEVVEALPVPVVVKEVGWGISAADARRLAEVGVAAIDVAGAGGTSWSEVEKHRAATAADRAVASAFIGWGIATADCLVEVHRALPKLPVFASGGLRDGVDVAKAIGLGATLAGLAGPLLRAATQSTDAVIEQLEVLCRTLEIAMFVTGAADLDALRDTAALRRVSEDGS